MHISCLVRRGIAYISCYVQVGERGPYHEIKIAGPVPVKETEQLQLALHNAILLGTPIVSDSDPRTKADADLRKLAGVKSWSSLYSNASVWNAWDRRGHYQLSRSKRSGRGWTEDPQQKFDLPPSATAEDAAGRLVEMIQAGTLS